MTDAEAEKIARKIFEISEQVAEERRAAAMAKWEAEAPAREISWLKSRVNALENNKLALIAIGLAFFTLLTVADLGKQFDKLNV